MADITRRSRIHLTGVPGRENRMRERERDSTNTESPICKRIILNAWDTSVNKTYKVTYIHVTHILAQRIEYF